MNERGQKPKHTVVRHLQALRLVRARRAVRQIPGSTPLPIARRFQHYAIVATAQLGKQRLARVVWPWQARPKSPEADPSVRVARGKSSNPTVLR
jgi:hypothetical protein